MMTLKQFASGKNPKEKAYSEGSAEPVAAVEIDDIANDQELRAAITAWARLSLPVRAASLAIVETSSNSPEAL